MRIGIGHPGQSDRVKGYVLHNFAKADSAWLEPLLGAIAAEAPLLVEGTVEKFQSRVAHAMQKVEISPPSPEDRLARHWVYPPPLPRPVGAPIHRGFSAASSDCRMSASRRSSTR